MENVTELKTKKTTFKDVKEQAEAEVRKENLEKYKKEYIKLLKEKEAAELIVRNIERQIEELEEKFGE